MNIVMPNKTAPPNRRPRFPFAPRREHGYSRCARPASSAAVGEPQRYRDMKWHSTLFGWSDPDQALRVAAGILGKRASGGLARMLGSAARGAKPSRQCIEPGSLNPG